MTLTAQQRFTISAAAAVLVLVGGIGYAWLSQLPAARALRESIDTDRAGIAVAEQLQSNLVAVRQEVATIEARQKELDTETWTFNAEDAFFHVWPALAAKRRVTIPEPKIADATPNSTLIPRAATIVISGPLPDVLAAVSDVQKIKPLVSITSLTIKPDSKTSVAAALEALTLWR